MSGWLTEYGFSAEEKRLKPVDDPPGDRMTLKDLTESEFLAAVVGLLPGACVALEAVDALLLTTEFQNGDLEVETWFDRLGPWTHRRAKRAMKKAGLENIVCYSALLEDSCGLGYVGRKPEVEYP